MDQDLMIKIKEDRQIKKFSAYGFLKNLRFFEPYLIIYLLNNGLNLFQVGMLFSIREAVMYIFEIPSGIIADFYGRKKELYMCFSFYILSFILFFFSQSFVSAAIAMTFFGLGEAFRSGTHKAMIYAYLEEKDWQEHKAYVYGRTRSFSLRGSAISAILAIVLILNLPSSRYIFLASIMPYILDLLLIMSYPNSLDKSGKKIKGKISDVIQTHLMDIYKRPRLRHIILGSSIYEAVFKSIKDMIQPILEVMILSSGVVLISQLTQDEQLKVILGLSYGFIYLLGAFASQKAYLLKQLSSSIDLLNKFHIGLLLMVSSIFIFIRLESVVLIVLAFVGLYVFRDMRKPIFVDACDDYMDKDQRATVLSIESQLKALFTVILAPMIGYIADNFGVDLVMISIALGLLLIYSSVRLTDK